jgi:hypothetical protein
MDARKFAEQFSADIKNVMQTGQPTIECEKLLTYVEGKMSSLQIEPTPA